MIIILSILSLLISNILAVAYGWSEAMYWYYVYNGKATRLGKYEHELWSFIRGVSYIPIFYILFTLFSWWSFIGMFSILIMFPFFHDGMYYLMRNKFDGSYPKQWKDMTASKKLSVTRKENETIIDKIYYKILITRFSAIWNGRLIMFIVGVLGYASMFFLY